MDKERIVLFGAGGSGRKLYKEYEAKEDVEVIAFADNFKTGELYGRPILKPEDLLDYDYDYLVIASVAAGPIEKKLLDIGIPRSKISKSYVEIMSAGRDVFLKRFAQEARRKGLAGDVAEAGVFQGDFASLINQYFPDKKLYLFDTFTGFDGRDTDAEEGYEKNPACGEHFKITSPELVLSKMKYPENCSIRQGYVPETLSGLEDLRFCFVNLDMDLYQPTLAALEWFWQRMCRGGVILVHDFFDETGTFPNLKKAVIQFAEKNGAIILPIGDDLSVALPKFE